MLAARRIFSFHPPKKITRGNYICANKYRIDELIPLYQDDHECFGVLVISGKEAMFYRADKYECQLLRKETLSLLKKHKKGGQSAARFGRMADNKREHTIDYVMDIFWNLFWLAEEGRVGVNGVIVAGPAEMKRDLVATRLFQKYFANSLICCLNLDKINDRTIHEVLAEAQEKIFVRKVTIEKKLMDEVIELQQTDYDLAYGFTMVKKKLSEGLLKKVIGVKAELSDDVHLVAKEIDEIKQLIASEFTGTQLVILETVAVTTSVSRDYGGWLGVQWFSY